MTDFTGRARDKAGIVHVIRSGVLLMDVTQAYTACRQQMYPVERYEVLEAVSCLACIALADTYQFPVTAEYAG